MNTASPLKSLQNQLQAYARWLFERGQRWPLPLRAKPQAEELREETPVEDQTTKIEQPDTVAATDPFLEIAAEAARCQACMLWQNRTNTTTVIGSSFARVVFVGDAPSVDADSVGKTFGGEEYGLLLKMADAMKLTEHEYCFTNHLMCRLPAGRAPTQVELHACEHLFTKLINATSPEVVVPLGEISTQMILGSDKKFKDLCGRKHEVKIGEIEGIKVVPTYHPRDLLRYPMNKRVSWRDLQLVMSLLGKEV